MPNKRVIATKVQLAGLWIGLVSFLGLLVVVGFTSGVFVAERLGTGAGILTGLVLVSFVLISLGTLLGGSALVDKK